MLLSCMHQQMCEVARLVCLSGIWSVLLVHSTEDTIIMVVAVHVCTVCVGVPYYSVLIFSCF